MKVNRSQLCKELIDYALDTGNKELFQILTSDKKYEYVENIIKRMEPLQTSVLYKLNTRINRISSMLRGFLEDEYNVYDFHVYDRDDNDVRHCRSDDGIKFKYWIEILNKHEASLYVEVENKTKENVK